MRHFLESPVLKKRVALGGCRDTRVPAGFPCFARETAKFGYKRNFLARDDGLDLDVEEQLELSEPKKYKVILLNDDYSTMDFVVEVLMDIFRKPFDEAVNIMLSIHRDGRGLCGVYPYDIAETKVVQVKQAAKKNGYPLRAVMEEA